MTFGTTLQAQAAAITTTIGTVPNVGLVHGWPRYGDAYEMWVTEIAGLDQIRAWEIGMSEPGATAQRISQGDRDRRTEWLIRGYHGLDDLNAAYRTIYGLAGDICDALDANPNLTGTCLQHDLAQMSAPTPFFMGGSLLTWTVTISLTTWSLDQLESP